MFGETVDAADDAMDRAEPQLLDSLRAVLKGARDVAREALPDAEQLLAEARASHTAVLDLLRGRVRDFTAEKEAFETKIAELEGTIAAKEDLRAEAEGKATAAESASTSLRVQLEEARKDRDGLRVQLDSALEDRKQAEVALDIQAAQFKNEQDKFLRQSQSLGVKLDEAQRQAEILLEERNALELRLQSMEKELLRLESDLDLKVRAFDKTMQEKENALQKVLLEKTAVDARLTALQEQWERISR